MNFQSAVEKGEKLKDREEIDFLVNKALSKGNSIALWKLPEKDTKNLLISYHHQKLSDFELNELAPGFIISPFLSSKEKVFLTADEFYSFPSDNLKGGNSATIKDGKEISKESVIEKNFFHNQPSQSHTNENYQSVVKAAIDEIQKGVLEKVVPSRFQDVALENQINLVDAFHKLVEKYPNALITLVSSPATGTWIGATPELLVQVDAQMIFRTVALAGTQPLTPQTNLKRAAWTQKEIEEQALVTRYVINCFKKIRVREYAEHGPHTVVAGNVLHLRTDFEIDMSAINFPTLGSVMLKLLHPTSAVCGMPLDLSVEFLKKHEGYDREFYTGYIGPVNIQQESNLFVNLRCAQFFDKKVRFYAGAGVTLDSDPQLEFEETELKMKTLQSIIL